MEAVVILEASFWRGRRVLVTGHTGFKGSWLTLWLLSLGAEVWGYALSPEPGRALFTDLGLDRFTGPRDWGNLHHRLGDVCDLEALRNCVQEAQPEVVIHLAAQPLRRAEPLGTWGSGIAQFAGGSKAVAAPCSV